MGEKAWWDFSHFFKGALETERKEIKKLEGTEGRIGKARLGGEEKKQRTASVALVKMKAVC